jgi:hypothetical protein
MCSALGALDALLTNVLERKSGSRVCGRKELGTSIAEAEAESVSMSPFPSAHLAQASETWEGPLVAPPLGK